MRISSLVLLTCFFISFSPVQAQKSFGADAKNEYVVEVPVTSLASKDGVLKNPILMDYLNRPALQVPPLTHYGINIFGGIFTGAAVGALGGLSVYSSQKQADSFNAIYISTGVMAILGGVTAAIITSVERKHHQPYSLGRGLFTAVWAGTLSGGALGTVVALIPYAKNKNTDVLLQGLGMGSLVGFAFGFVGYFVAPYIKTHKNVVFLYNSELTDREAIQHRLSVRKIF